MSFNESFNNINSNCIHLIFDNVAKRFPDKIAVTDGNSEISYKELSEKSTALAHALACKGVKSGDLVCIYLSRSINMIIGILGVLKIGAAYIPIDPDYPAQRIHDIFDISGAKYCVSDSNKQLNDIECTYIIVDCISDYDNGMEISCNTCEETNLAYVIFTSGSTGKPKGVMIEHNSVVRLFKQTDDIYHFNEDDIWSLFHSIAFDYSVWEMWGALLSGGKLVIISREIALNPESFFQLLYEEKVTVLCQTPTAFRNFCLAALQKEQKRLDNLRFVIFGGEKLDFEVLNPWIDKYGDLKPVLVNMYGITEVTVHSTWKVISQKEIGDSSLSLIGAPIPDLVIEIVDFANQKVGRGEKGRMLISGDGVARGYLNRKDLTDERFFIRVDQNGLLRRWFDTGDLAIEIAENEFVYVGRNDRQVKISGYRIELEEIECCFKKFIGIKDCMVVEYDYGQGDNRLGIFIIPEEVDGKELPIDALRQYATEKLPIYMRPSTYTVVDKFPMNINGKFSPSETEVIQESEKDKNLIDSSNKQMVYNIWSDILGEMKFSDEDNFFYLGGTSFMMIRMFRKLREIFDIDIQPEDFSDDLSINSVLEVIEKKNK